MNNALATTNGQSRNGQSLPPPATTNQVRALLIERDQDSRELMKFILERKGFNVLAIEDSEQFLTLTDNLPPDLLIINILMPVDKDFGILQQICQQAAPYNVSIIVTSGYPYSFVPTESLGSKCLGFFMKPIDFDQLDDLIEDFLSCQNINH